MFLGFLFLILGSNFILFALSSCFLTSSLAFFSGTEESLLSDICPGKLTKLLGQMNFWDELGTMFGLLVAGFLSQFWNLQNIYLLGLLAIILAFVSLFGIKTEKEIITKTNQVKIEWGLIKKLIWQFLPLFLFFLAFAERGEIIFQTKINQVFGISFLALAYFFGKIGSILGSFLAHKFEKVNLFWWILMQILGISLLFLNNFWVIVAFFVFLFTENILRTLFKSKLINLALNQYKTSILSVFSFGSMLFLVVFKPVLGIVTDYNFTFGIFGLIIIRLLGIFIFK